MTDLPKAAQQYLIATAHLGACPGARELLRRAINEAIDEQMEKLLSTRKESGPKLTPWFDYCVKPARKGVYERHIPGAGIFFSHWNGKHWGLGVSNPEEATLLRNKPSFYNKCRWRGLCL
ncbi:hypothetical protein UFOVP708_36 [uncultured Caudovirales phage]|uniref:Uncharacterized protein n=1 Tax=uncultured Caudovirales phage TaxID=2100421 RepID=A0A6J5NJF5_9CAUD|nr:hypothetical protein UFOVP708_36 [uncultured Caudovirales phage]